MTQEKSQRKVVRINGKGQPAVITANKESPSVQSRRLCIRERFDIERNGVQTSTENDFVMRCWTPEEIAAHLSHAGLDPIVTHSTYGEADLAWSDRLVVVALKRVHAPYVSTQ